MRNYIYRRYSSNVIGVGVAGHPEAIDLEHDKYLDESVKQSIMISSYNS